MSSFSKAVPMVVMLIAACTSQAIARNVVVTPVNAPDAAFTLYNCKGEDIFSVIHSIELGGYFTNVSTKDIVSLAVHYRMLRLDGSQIVGFMVRADKRVTAGTKNSLEARWRTRFTEIDHAECAPAYAKFSDGTEWTNAQFSDSLASPAPSAAPAASPSPPA